MIVSAAGTAPSEHVKVETLLLAVEPQGVTVASSVTLVLAASAAVLTKGSCITWP
jgi:hypothetical protein